MDANKKPANHPVIREASFEDHRQITLLASRHGLGTKNYAQWRHLWINNPVYIEFQRDWPIGWVLENGEKQIVGYIGNIPLLYEFQGRKVIAASAHGWVVDPDYRSYSILLMSRYFGQKNVDLYLNTTVNSAGSRAFSIFRSSKVPVGAWDQSDFWITNYQGFASSWLNKRAPVAQVLSRPLSVALYFGDKITRETFGALGTYRNGVEVGQCANFDRRFDDFWEMLRRRNSHRLLAVRTREMLDWHFGTALLQNRLWILTVMKGSDLSAYALFYRQDNGKFDLKRVRLVDFQALDEEGHDPFLPILSSALERCQNECMHMLECIGLRPSQREITAKLEPHQRRLSSWFYYYKAKDLSFAETLKDPMVWDPSGFDGDASL
jgi:hypothetical protein